MVLLTFASVAASIVVNSKARTLGASQMVVQTRAERVDHLAETLQLTARLAVETGDRADSQTYRIRRAELHRALAELQQALIIPANARTARELGRIEERRASIEDAAMLAAEQDNREVAQAMLQSPRYQQIDSAYSNGVSLIQRRSLDFTRQLSSDLEQFSWYGRLASLVGIPIVLLALLFIVGPARRWGEALDQARSDAEAAGNAKSDFLATMSHEMRTPLNSIIGFTDLLLEDPTLTAEQKRQINLIQESGSALLVVVNDVLDYSAIEAGKLNLHVEPFQLEALVGNATSIIRGYAEAKGLELSVDIDPAVDGFFAGDQQRLRQVLLNLLNNAVKFTRDGEVRVTVGSQDEDSAVARIHFEIADTGVGIPAAAQPLLFEKFSQADSSVRRSYGGSGLGLAISKRIVEMMDGEIGFSSTEGKGSQFWFTIPLPRSTCPPDKRPAVAPGSAPGARILLVEDIPANQELALAMLNNLGHRTVTANDGFAAVEAARTGVFDLILMDIQMPRMDGFAATRAIQGLGGRAARTPIVAMTANVLPAQVMQFQAAGMDSHIAKPVRQAALAKAIGEVLKGSAEHQAGSEGLGEEECAFDRDVWNQVAGLLAAERLGEHLDSLAQEIGLIAAAGAAAPDIGGRAHKLVSRAGSLGFLHLSKLSAQLEEAVGTSGGEDSAQAFDRMLGAASAALPKIEELRASL